MVVLCRNWAQTKSNTSRLLDLERDLSLPLADSCVEVEV